MESLARASEDAGERKSPEPGRCRGAARKYLAEQMEAYFFGAGADVAAGYMKPGSK
jgi:hypothetical protein